MKDWYLSKTIWANVLAGLLLWLNHRGHAITDAEAAACTVVMNMLLRVVTKEALRFRPANSLGDGLVLAILLGACCLGSGCVSRHVYNQSEQICAFRVAAIRASALGEGAVGIGLDVTKLDVLAEQPWKQAGAAIADAGLMYAGYEVGSWIVDQLNGDGGGGGDSSQDVPSVYMNVGGDNNTLVVGKRNPFTVDQSTTTYAPPVEAAPVEATTSKGILRNRK